MLLSIALNLSHTRLCPAVKFHGPCPGQHNRCKRQEKLGDAAEGCTLCISPVHAPVDFDPIPALFFPFFCWDVAARWVSGESRGGSGDLEKNLLPKKSNHFLVQLGIDDSIKDDSPFFPYSKSLYTLNLAMLNVLGARWDNFIFFPVKSWKTAAKFRGRRPWIWQNDSLVNSLHFPTFLRFN